MADKYMFNPLKVDMHPPQRYLRAFAAIDQTKLISMAEQLRRGIALRCRCCWTATEYGEGEGKHGFWMVGGWDLGVKG